MAINKGGIDKHTRRVLHYVDFNWLRDEAGERLALDLILHPRERDAVLLKHACGLCDDLPELPRTITDDAGLPTRYFGPATPPPDGWLEVGDHDGFFNEEGDPAVETAYDNMPDQHAVSTHFVHNISNVHIVYT